MDRLLAVLRKGATAYRVQATGGEVREEPLPVEHL